MLVRDPDLPWKRKFWGMFQPKPPGMQASILVPVPSQDKLGGLTGKASSIQLVRMMEVGAPIVWLGWHPAGLSVHLHHKTQKAKDG